MMRSTKKMAILITSVLLVSALALVLPASAADKYLWEQVSEEGFGDLTNDYAWSMATYTVNGTEYLYVGTLNTNLSSTMFDPANWSNVTDGCEIWRTNGTEGPNGNYVWEQVMGPTGTQSIIKPNGSTAPATAGFAGFNLGVRKMLVYQDLLWVGTMRPACEVWVTNGTHWKLANVPGFGDLTNTSVRSMTVFQDALYVGVDNAQTGAVVMNYTGETEFGSIGTLVNMTRWDTVSTPGFGEPEINLGVGELITFSASEEYLYAGTWNFTAAELVQMLLETDYDSLNGCQVWRTNGTVNASDPPRLVWEKVADSGFDSTLNGAVMSSAVFNGSLYLGTMNFGSGAEIWRTATGTDWECVADLGFLNFTLMPPPPTVDFRGFGNGYMWNMIVFDNKLFVGTLNPILGGQVWMSTTGDPNSFEQVNVNGMNEERKIPIDIDSLLFMGIDQYGVRTFAEFRGALHLGTASFGDWVDKAIEQETGNLSTNFSEYVGCEIWRTNGTMYTPPEIEVTKTVWDPNVGDWIEKRSAGLNDTVRFRSTIHITGTYNLTNLTVVDFLSSSLNYSDNATLQYPNGTIIDEEPYWESFSVSFCSFSTPVTILLWYFDDVTFEHCQTITMEYNATVVEQGLDINFLFAGGGVEATGECGYGWDYALIFSGPSSGDATDPIGSVQEVYTTSEPVYATGSGFDNDSRVDIYIVDDYSWNGYENIGNFKVYASATVLTDAAGNIVPTEIWSHPIPGEYDMVFDANQNGIFDVATDFVDHIAHPGFTVVGQVPVLTPLGIAALLGLLSIIATNTLLRRKRR